MSKAPINSLKKMGISIMDYKFIKILFIIFFIFYHNTSISEIVYDKDKILITKNEIIIFQNLYKNFKGIDINKNNAIKNIILQKKVIEKFIKLQKEYIENLDNLIVEENGETIRKNEIRFNFIRYAKIQNEFIYDYFNSEFTIKDLEIILNKFTEIKLPISDNNCLTISKQHNFKNNNSFIKSLFNDLKNNSQDYSFKIDKKAYDICINNKFYQIINEEISRYIEIKTENKFKAFVYES